MADILMYHGIDTLDGPTSIPPDVFAAQISALADSGRPVLTLTNWLLDRRDDAVVITFDDAFTSFAEAALPELERFGFPATVYVPTRHVGGAERWASGHPAERPVMDWSALSALPRDLVDLGGHSRSHPHLTKLGDAELVDEIEGSLTDLSDHFGSRPCHFAAPYGDLNPRVRNVIGEYWQSNVSVALAQASRESAPLDLPRIEMFYFCDIDRWRAHLAGRGNGYFRTRQVARTLRKMLGG